MGVTSSLLSAGLSGVATVAPVIGNIYSGRRQERNQMRYLQQRQQLEEQKLRQQQQIEREKIATDTQNTEAKRRAALKRAVARSQASFAGRGISPTSGGSAEAVLLGLFEESDDERAYREQVDSLRERSLQQQYNSTVSRNLLALNKANEDAELQQLKAFGKLI